MNRSGIQQAIGNLSAWVGDAQAASGRGGSVAGRSAGDLWIEADRLKRAGHDVRQLAWQISEIEESLRRSPSDTTALRHRLNSLSHELAALQRRQR